VFPEHEKYPYQMITAGSGKIIVFIDELDNYYKSGLAHEYHHSVWTEKHFNEDDYLTILDSLIMEGQAVMFETLVYPDSNSTDFVVDDSFNKEYWKSIESYLESSTSGYSIEILMGGSKGLPDYYGYSEGYKMVRSYLNMYPDMTVEEWTSKKAKEIFEEGNYIANYE
jgi:uncharacterized protein YjaZ